MIFQCFIVVYRTLNKPLFSDFTQGMILPKKSDESKTIDLSKTSAKGSGVKLPLSSSSAGMEKLSLGTKIETDNYECYETFKCPPMDLYNVLTQPELVHFFTRAEAKIEADIGGKFSILGGQISGEFTELVILNLNDFHCILKANTNVLNRFRTGKLSKSGGLPHGQRLITQKLLFS